MNKAKNNKAAAVIDIGSSLVKMRVCQRKEDQISTLDQLEYPIRIGHEVFHFGAVSPECLNDLVRILRGFLKVMREYGVRDYKAVATTALREAKNKSFIIDQIRVQTHIDVEILEDNEEKTLIYSAVIHALRPQLQSAATLISHIGTGSVGFGIFDTKNLCFSQNISIGALKLHDVLGSVQEHTTDFASVVEEYLNALLGRITLPVEHKSIDTIALTGAEIETIARLCGAPLEHEVSHIKPESITDLFKSIRAMPPEKISSRYHISEAQAEMLYSALAIYVRLSKMTQAKRILAPRIDLWDPLCQQLLLPDTKKEYLDAVENHAVACAKTFAQRYHCELSHAQAVSEYACRIFDSLKDLHGLNQRHRMILRLASLLHDCGYFVDAKYHLESTFRLIPNLDITGATGEEMLMTAYVARFNELETPNYDDLDFIHIRAEQKVICSKLAAIFRVANSLDKSQKQKAKDVQVRLSDETLWITVHSEEKFCLEQWAFELCCPFFKDVFGLHPCLTVKTNLL